MPVPTYTVSRFSKTLVARDVYELRFPKPDGFSFKPGQFILFDVPHPDNPGDIQARAYSIASLPDDPEILLCIKLIDGGRMSRFLVERLKEGETQLTMKGPFGNFVLQPGTSKEYLFVCTGAGIAPFRSQILESLRAGETRRMDLIFGVRSGEDLFWVDQLEAIAKAHPNFFLHVALSAPTGDWTGHRGRVQTLVPLIVPDLSGKIIYVCGNPDMTKEMKELCLTKWGVEKKDLHVEGFI